jgi:long-chain fatty acid transport protein
MTSIFPRIGTSIAFGALLNVVFVAGPAFSAGFALQETSGSGLGNAFAGGAAAAEDASTVWSNAAGMARLGSGQVVGVLNLIKPSIRFSNGASQAATAQPLGGEGGNAGSLNVVPNLYLSYPIDPRWTFGIGVNAPFGLVTEYENGWIGRFQGIKSQIKTYNLNPAVSWRANERVAVGAGVNLQRLEGTFTSDANYAAALLQAASGTGRYTAAQLGQIAQDTAGLASGVKVTGSDDAWGWNLGILLNIDENNRIGAQYRSALKYRLSGNVDFSNPAVPATLPGVVAVAGQLNAVAFNNSGISSEIKLPEIVNVSYFGKINALWDVMADVQYTGWGSIQTLAFTRADGTPLQSTDLNFRGAWRLAVGSNYRYSEQWLLRGGLAYDQTPVPDANRTVRLPIRTGSGSRSGRNTK